MYTLYEEPILTRDCLYTDPWQVWPTGHGGGVPIISDAQIRESGVKIFTWRLTVGSNVSLCWPHGEVMTLPTIFNKLSSGMLLQWRPSELPLALLLMFPTILPKNCSKSLMLVFRFPNRPFSSPNSPTILNGSSLPSSLCSSSSIKPVDGKCHFQSHV